MRRIVFVSLVALTLLLGSYAGAFYAPNSADAPVASAAPKWDWWGDNCMDCSADGTKCVTNAYVGSNQCIQGGDGCELGPELCTKIDWRIIIIFM